jgi:assimilatory nitrate reductase catalytic subunit
MSDVKSPLSQRPTMDYVICNCFEINYSTLVATIRNGAHDFHAVQKELKMGTRCGSCVPEILEILAQEGF